MKEVVRRGFRCPMSAGNEWHLECCTTFLRLWFSANGSLLCMSRRKVETNEQLVVYCLLYTPHGSWSIRPAHNSLFFLF